MDSLALSILVFTFFAAMMLYFATHALERPQPRLKEAYKQPLRALKKDSIAGGMPEIFKHNIAVKKMMQMQRI